MSQERAIRVLIAGTQLVLRSALEMYLELRPEFEVVGQAASDHELLIEAEACLPEVILIDWDRFNGPPEASIAALHRLEPRPSIVVLTASLQADHAAMLAGADSVVSKSSPPKSLLTAIYRAQLEEDE